jgi:hypothetical protein
MQRFIRELPTMYKAVAAFCALFVPFLTAVGAATSDGIVTASEWTTVVTAGAALVGGTRAVWQVRNK